MTSIIEIPEIGNTTIPNIPNILNPSNTIPNSTKLTIDLPIILIDTSYWLYYRFFALRNWYTRRYPENIVNNPNFNIEHNWLEDTIFITKYKKMFFEHIKKICRLFRTKLYNVVFCIDCPHKYIWRCDHTDDYKGTRPESHRKNQFNSFNLFSNIKQTLLPILQTKYNMKILKCDSCEADDIIGNFAVYLANKNCNNVYILANDNDYLQICNNTNIKLINGLGKIISNSEHKLYLGEKYLISKILSGDISDNIKCCNIDRGFLENGINNGHYTKIYKSILNNLLNNNDKYEILKNILYEIRKCNSDSNSDTETITNANTNANIFQDNKFVKNALLMDFQMLPKELKCNLEIKFNELV